MRRVKIFLCALVLGVLLCGCVMPAWTNPAVTPVPKASVSPAPTASPTPSPTHVPTPSPAPEELLLQSMTTEEKAAQLFFIRCPETDTESVIETMQPGGVLLFGRDFKGLSKEQVSGKISGYQTRAKLGLLIGTDEEGGTVVRVSSNPQLSDAVFPSPKELYQAGGVELLCAVEADKCALLSSLGVNVNFAPVCDLSVNGFMAARSLGLPAEETAETIMKLVSVYEEQNVGCVLKHFPGYGEAADTHEGIVYDERSLKTFRSTDFKPFLAGISAGADCVLVAHNIVTCLDDTVPASLSAPWHELLRGELGFDGVIITDDLAMGAVTNYTDGASAAVAAILAGNDMLCCSDYQTQYAAVLEAVQNGTISEARLNESVLRVLRWKLELGLIG